MSRPVLLAVDDDGPVLAAVERDLRDRYAEHYQVVAASSGDQALDVLRRLRLRDENVALLLVDQRMPGMTGTELLAASRELYPDAKRVLLTAYADTDAAIRAINDVDVDAYLLKPWDPPEEKLYPTVDAMLKAWKDSRASRCASSWMLPERSRTCATDWEKSGTLPTTPSRRS